MSFTIAGLRRAFQERYSGYVSSGDFDAADVDRLMRDDALCQCYAAARGDLESSLQQIEAGFRWRREDGINGLTADSFPLESLQKGFVYFHSEDREGHPLMYFRIQDCGRTTQEELRLIRQFIGWLLDRRHKRDPTRKIAILFDMTNAGLSNLNLDLVRFIVRAFQVYYPKFLGYLFVYEMPWVLSAAWKMIRSWLDKESQKRIIFLRRSSVQDYISPDKLWTHMGGTDDFRYQYSPGIFDEDAASGGGGDEFVDAEASLPAPQQPQQQQQQQQQSMNIRQRIGTNSSARLSGSNGSAEDAASAAAAGASGSGLGASSYLGRYLSISPADRVTFRPSSGTPGSIEAQRSLTLTSTNQLSLLVFKVKTTCPADYKVRPSCGLLDPGAAVTVVVTYKPAGAPAHAQSRSDKFQILAAPVAAGLTKEAALEALKTSPPDAVMEHRLLCRVELPGSGQPNEEQQLAALHAEVSRLSTLVAKMSTQHSQRLAYARMSVVLLAFLLLGLMFLLGWSFGRSASRPSIPDIVAASGATLQSPSDL